ncbi:MAG: D-alanine--D-alanine ligase [Candidatus Symbiothrix sp.]|jgi:D-alanine-D-alanine ligase|nr:D-alanine--D-alanine ligase [Candidatus Symbiothrix sp.]
MLRNPIKVALPERQYFHKTCGKKTIAIIAGGYSSEIVVSMKSAQGIQSFIDPERYASYIVLITKEKWVTLLPNNEESPIDKNDFSFMESGDKVKFDFAYITIHGTPGEDGLLQGYFDMLDIPYSCCGVLAASLTFNKYFCKKYLQSFGVKSAPCVLLRKKDSWNGEDIISELGLPVFVKPNDGGSSFGITKVNSVEQLQMAVNLAFTEGNEVLMESFMQGTEVTCGCYRIGDMKTAFPVTEVVPQNEFFDYDAKYNGQVSEITPARISQALTEEVRSLTAKIYDYLGAKGIIRVDYIISPQGEVRLLEVNTTPGMTATSFIPQQVKAAGLNIREVMTEIIEYELNRK